MAQCLTESACAICQQLLEADPIARLPRYYFRKCEHCGSWTCLPRPGAGEQAAIHDSEDYFEHPYFRLRRAITASQRKRCLGVFKHLSKAVDPASLRGERMLDIGCDTGLFLKTAQQEFGIIPMGVDVAARAIEEARAQGIEAFHGILEDAPRDFAGFAAASAIDLIEHVPDPAALLREVRNRLRPGGVVYLETPNIQSVIYRFGRVLNDLTGGKPADLMERLFPPQHIQYFTLKSFRQLADGVGLQVVSLTTRVLPAAHIAASLSALVPISILQACDRILGTEILICSVLMRPLDVCHSEAS
jgi:SAM-dependent methyltransferase